jgi:ubiquinone biosynthesis protein
MTATTPTAPLTLQKVPLSSEVARIGATAWQAVCGGARFAARALGSDDLAATGAGETRNTFAALGPTYVKLGQLIASSPGVFPRVLSDEFRTLLDRVPPADPEQVRRLLTDQLGRDPDEVFAEFDPEPIASASISQVHEAVLVSGEHVVVKIQRPGIKARLAADLQILQRTAAVVEMSPYGRMLSAKAVIEDFTANLNSELDFRTEAAAMEEWTAAISGSRFADQVRVPKVFWDYTTERVITLEFVEAIRIDNVADIRRAGHDGTKIVKTLLLSLLESAFTDGIFHGDLHAGNVLVDAQGRIVLLDWGIVGRFDDKSRLIVRELLGNLMRSNYEAAGQALAALGTFGKPGSVRDTAKDLRRVAAPIGGTDLGDMSYADLGRQLANLAKTYDARLPRELVLVGKQLLYVERYMKLLAPRWKAMSDPQVVGYTAGLLKDSARAR